MNNIEESNQTARLSIRDILLVVFKRKKLFSKIVLFTTLFVTMGVYVMDLPYYVVAEVVVERGTSSNMPTHSVSQWRYLEREEIINSEVEILGSRQVAEGVVEKIGVSDKETWGKKIKHAIFSPFYILGLLDDVSEKEKFISTVQKQIKVKPVPKSDVIKISYLSSDDPNSSTTMVNTLLDSYLEKRNEIYRSSGIVAFYENQAAIVRGRIDELRRQIAVIKAESASNQIAKEQDANLVRLADLQAELAHVKSVRDDVAQKISGLKSSHHIYTPFNTKSQQYSVIDELGSKLLNMDVEKNKVEQDYRGDSKKVSALVAEREKLKNNLLSSLESLGGSLDLQIKGLQGEIDQINNREESLTNWKVKLGEVESALEQAEKSHRSYTDLREQARIDEVSRGVMSQVKVLSYASVPTKPFLPRLAYIVIALILSTIFGFGLILVQEYFDNTIDDANDIEYYIGINPIAVLPELRTSSAEN